MILPKSPFLKAWKEEPFNTIHPQVWCDYLDETQPEIGKVFRELYHAFNKIKKVKIPKNFEEELNVSLPKEFHCVFAFGCAARCTFWWSPHPREQRSILKELIVDLTVEPFSKISLIRSSKCYRKWLDLVLENDMIKRYLVSLLQIRCDAARSRSARFRSAENACNTATNSRVFRVQSSSKQTSYSKEQLWQSHWLQSIKELLGNKP